VPIDVDVEHRLAELARATLSVAGERGAEGVTIREVAKALGGSTKMVTNYLPTRSALLSNAVQHALQTWTRDLEAELEGVAAQDRLRTVIRWSAGTAGDDTLLRRLFVEMLSRPGDDGAMTQVRDDARAERVDLHDAAEEAGAPDPELAADALFLLLRGFYLASLEDPGEWTSERVTPVLDRIVTLLGG
jgi:AcrR family transcriptional regulator